MEAIFKVGDKVYCFIHGNGIVKYVDHNESYPVLVDFGFDTNSYTFDGKLYQDCKPTLSFTEYTLQGFTQERLIELPEVGELCLMRDLDDEVWTAVIFQSYDKGEDFPFVSDINECYKQMKRIKILD